MVRKLRYLAVLLSLSAVVAFAQAPNYKPGGGLTGQVKGQTAVGGLASNAITTSPEALRVSAFCRSSTSCNPGSGITNESTAITAMQTQCKSGGASNSTCHIVDDMCGTQTITVQPFSMTGRFDFLNNCSSANPHIWSLDGIGTLTTSNSGLTITGMGGNGFLQQPTNVYIQACNTNIDNCTTGFVVPNASVTSFTVAGAVGTVVLGGGGIPFSGNGPGVMAPGRLLYIGPDEPTTNNRGAWVILTVTDATHLTVGVVSGTTSTCAATCGGTAYLDTPIMEIGSSNGGGVFDVQIGDLLLNCHYVIGCGGFVNAVGQENSRFLMTHVSNADTYYGRLDQSAAYNGSGTSGGTNSGPYGPWSGNINPEVCGKTGGCVCQVGTANGLCPSSPQPVGTLMTCGSGTSGTAAIISPDPCDNPNFVGFAFTGVGNAQGFRQVLGITSSVQDKTNTAAGIPGLIGGTGGEAGSTAATTGTAILICGARATFGDIHTEFFVVSTEVGCNSALNATWADSYAAVLTSSVSFTGGLWAFGTGGAGLDIGAAGNGAFIQDIALNEVSIGNGSGTLIQDNISGNTVTGSASEQSETYFHGHGTQPTVWGSAPTIGFQSQTHVVLGATSGSCSLTAAATGGTLNICSVNATMSTAGGLNVVTQTASTSVTSPLYQAATLAGGATYCGGACTASLGGGAGVALFHGGDNSNVGSTATASSTIYRGGMLTNATPNAAALEGATQIVSGALKGSAIAALGDVLCGTTTAFTLTDCSNTGPAVNIVGIATSIANPIGYVTNGQALVKTDGAVTIGDILCMGTTAAGQAHDNGTVPCLTAGSMIGVVLAVAGTINTATGATSGGTAMSTTLPLVALNINPVIAAMPATSTVTGADYTNTSVTPSTVWSFTLPATAVAKNYKYNCEALWESTAATLVGPVIGLNLSAAPTQLTGSAWAQTALAGTDTTGYLSNTTTGSQTLITSAAAGVTSTNYRLSVWGTIEGAAVAGSTFIINAAATSGSTASLNIRRGGWCTLQQIVAGP